MAAGKPRIGSNVDGIPNVINDGIDGLLVEPENVEDLTQKLDILMGNKGLRKQLGEAGSKRAKEEFTEENYINNVINFYNEVSTI
jgi:glycosyltransferase involved in cell wall biosynthesis